ncbi:hypothetical protein DFH09DRAFT_1105563 [Mycena vulgaris]|nr:hypothetical protein DFH09DRAFT_1105563 [Mycena vulgaris]
MDLQFSGKHNKVELSAANFMKKLNMLHCTNKTPKAEKFIDVADCFEEDSPAKKWFNNLQAAVPTPAVASNWVPFQAAFKARFKGTPSVLKPVAQLEDELSRMRITLGALTAGTVKRSTPKYTTKIESSQEMLKKPPRRYQDMVLKGVNESEDTNCMGSARQYSLHSRLQFEGTMTRQLYALVGQYSLHSRLQFEGTMTRQLTILAAQPSAVRGDNDQATVCTDRTILGAQPSATKGTMTRQLCVYYNKSPRTIQSHKCLGNKLSTESSEGRALPSAPSRLLCLGMAVNSSCYVIILSNGDGSAVGPSDATRTSHGLYDDLGSARLLPSIVALGRCFALILVRARASPVQDGPIAVLGLVLSLRLAGDFLYLTRNRKNARFHGWANTSRINGRDVVVTANTLTSAVGLWGFHAALLHVLQSAVGVMPANWSTMMTALGAIPQSVIVLAIANYKEKRSTKADVEDLKKVFSSQHVKAPTV